MILKIQILKKHLNRKFQKISEKQKKQINPIEKKQESDNKERKKTHININYIFNFLKEKIKDIKRTILGARKNIKNIYSKFKEKCAKVRAVKAFYKQSNY